MNAQSRLSAKGQVVIPKDVRDRLGWPLGSKLDVIETSDSVTFRKPQERKKLPVAEALAKIASRIQYNGPPVPVEDLGYSAEAFRKWAERNQ